MRIERRIKSTRIRGLGAAVGQKIRQGSRGKSRSEKMCDDRSSQVTTRGRGTEVGYGVALCGMQLVKARGGRDPDLTSMGREQRR